MTLFSPNQQPSQEEISSFHLQNISRAWQVLAAQLPPLGPTPVLLLGLDCGSAILTGLPAPHAVLPQSNQADRGILSVSQVTALLDSSLQWVRFTQNESRSPYSGFSGPRDMHAAASLPPLQPLFILFPRASRWLFAHEATPALGPTLLPGVCNDHRL